MASFLPMLLFLATPAHPPLACWHLLGLCPGPFSFVSPWGSHLLLCFHSSILLARLGWPWGSVVVKTELTLSQTSAPNSVETAPFSEDIYSPSAVLEPDGTTESHPRESTGSNQSRRGCGKAGLWDQGDLEPGELRRAEI